MRAEVQVTATGTFTIIIALSTYSATLTIVCMCIGVTKIAHRQVIVNKLQWPNGSVQSHLPPGLL